MELIICIKIDLALNNLQRLINHKPKQPTNQLDHGLVDWGCRIHWMHFCRGVRSLPNEYPGYDTKQFDDEVTVILELWGMRSTPSLPSLPSPLWSRVVAPNRALSMGQVEVNCILMLNWITWNRTVLIFKLCTYAKLNCLN